MYRMYSKHVSVCCCQSSGAAGRLWNGSGISREYPGPTRAGPVRALGCRQLKAECINKIFVRHPLLRQAEAPESQSSHRYGRVDFPCIMTTLLLIRAFSLCCPGLATTFWSSWIED